MFGSGAAAAADQPRPGIAGEAGIARHQLGRAIIFDLAIDKARDAGIAFGDDDRIGIGRASCRERVWVTVGVGGERRRSRKRWTGRSRSAVTAVGLGGGEGGVWRGGAVGDR